MLFCPGTGKNPSAFWPTSQVLLTVNSNVKTHAMTIFALVVRIIRTVCVHWRWRMRQRHPALTTRWSAGRGAVLGGISRATGNTGSLVHGGAVLGGNNRCG